MAGNSLFLFNFLDFALILVAFWAVYRHRVQALFVGSLAGLMQDAVLGWPLGFNGFGKTVAAFLMGQAAKRFNVEGHWIRFALITTGAFANTLCIFVLFLLLQRSVNVLFIGAALMQSIITGAAGTLVFSLIDSYQSAQAGKAG
ncbi:MAG: rod shape-determining protein MreD [Acidobacteria bacterium]|nr:rod shape-determining protein MreD [Acidobacteriota bacterium]